MSGDGQRLTPGFGWGSVTLKWRQTPGAPGCLRGAGAATRVGTHIRPGQHSGSPLTNCRQSPACTCLVSHNVGSAEPVPVPPGRVSSRTCTQPGRMPLTRVFSLLPLGFTLSGVRHPRTVAGGPSERTALAEGGPFVVRHSIFGLTPSGDRRGRAASSATGMRAPSRRSHTASAGLQYDLCTVDGTDERNPVG